MPCHNHSIRWTASCALSAVCAAGLAVWAGGRARAEGPAPAEPPSVVVAPCEQPPLLDGALDDACWRTAAPLAGLHVIGTGLAVPYTALVCCDSDWLYLAVDIVHPEPRHIKRAVYEPDGQVQADDSLELFLDPGTGGAGYLHYMLNAANIKGDQRVLAGGRRDRLYTMPWRTATRLTEHGWAAEIAIPLFTLHGSGGGTPAAARGPVRMNLVVSTIVPQVDPYGAVICETACHATWAPLPDGKVHQPECFGEVRGLPPGEGLRRGRLFLPAIARARARRFEIRDGLPCYTLSVCLRNAWSAAGTAEVQVLDRPVVGEPTMTAARAELAANAGSNEVELLIAMPTVGRRMAAVWVCDAAQGGALESCLVDEDALAGLDPLSVVPDRNYYTTEQAATLCCRVGLPDDLRLACRIAVKAPDGSPVAEAGPLDQETRLAIPLAPFPEGTHLLTVDLTDAAGTLIASRGVELRKLPPNPGCEVKVDLVNRVLLRNGDPFYLFGMSAAELTPHDEAMFRRMHEAGFNWILWNCPLPPDDYDLAAFLEQARTYDLAVSVKPAMFLPRPPKGSATYNVMARWAGHAKAEVTITTAQEVERAIAGYHERRPRLEAKARDMRTSPVYLIHVNADEPNIVNPDARIAVAEQYYKNLMEWDPYHPAFLIFASSFIPPGKHWTAWAEALSYDIYLSPDRTGRMEALCATLSKETVELAKQARAANKVMFMTLLSESLGAGRSARPLRPAEQRCQTYLSLIHGATGVLYFDLAITRTKSSWDTLTQLGQEMKRIGPAIVAPKPPQDIVYRPGTWDPVKGVFPDVQAALFRHPDGCYLLLAVNSHPYPVDAAYAVDAFRGGKVRRLFGVPDVKPTADGAFADRLEAYGTRAYEFDVQPAPGASGPIRVDVSLTAHSDAAQPETVFNTVDIAARRNVAVNPSAEIMNSPDVPDFLYPTHYRWPVPIGETGAIWNVVTDRPVHGRQCIRMDFPETSTPAPRGYNKQTGTQGKCFLPVLREPNPYVFSLYLRGGRTGDTAAVSVTGLKPGQGTFSLTPDWQRFSIQGTMASGGEKTFTISTSRGSTVWMDAIQMEAGAAPTPFTEE